MPRLTLVQVIYNHRRFIPQVYDAVRAQSFRDFHMVAVIAGSEDGSKEYIAGHYPEVEIIDPGYNIGFARGHNLVFQKYDSEFFQLVNPDLIMQPDYIEKMLAAFADPKVGAATGKLLLYDFDHNKPTGKIDSTGVILFRSGRARDRGQHEIDSGQYDALTEVMGVSGAGPMFRRSALEAVKYPRPDGRTEYFDEDFHSYWEDVDLSWRMQSAGYSCKFVPNAVAYHGRASGSSQSGYKDIGKFIRHHKNISRDVRRLNYTNHIFMYIKNTPHYYWNFFVREIMMLGYILIFETATLAAVPRLFKLLPAMRRKRAFIRRHRAVSQEYLDTLFTPGHGI
jgi:GT2 family glycosyltransferase